MEFSGRLRAFPPGELLAWAANDRRTGSLLLRRPDRETRIWFRDGGIVAAVSDQAAEYFGQHLLLEGHLDHDTLFEVLTECQETGRRLGRALLEKGILGRETIAVALRSHVQDLVLGAFLWRHGVFSFRSELPPAEAILPDPIDPMALAFEGARWIDEERRIRERLPSNRIRVGPGSGWPGENLSPRQVRVSEGLKARPAIDELYPKVRGSWFRFLVALDELLAPGIAEVVHRPDDTTEETRETTLYELLLEQASDEQKQDSRASVRFPVAVLERLVPVWVEAPAESDLGPLTERTRSFLRSFDGSARLGALLSPDGDGRREELELVLLYLQGERLALLPAPSDEVVARAGSWWARFFGR